MYRNSLKGLESDVTAFEGVRRESLGCLRIQAPSCGPCVRVVFPCISFQAAGYHLQEQSGAATTAKNTRTRYLHALYQRDNYQYMLRGEVTGIHTKTALAPKILNPHKVQSGAPTYKQSSETIVDNCFS